MRELELSHISNVHEVRLRTHTYTRTHKQTHACARTPTPTCTPPHTAYARSTILVVEPSASFHYGAVPNNLMAQRHRRSTPLPFTDHGRQLSLSARSGDWPRTARRPSSQAADFTHAQECHSEPGHPYKRFASNVFFETIRPIFKIQA